MLRIYLAQALLSLILTGLCLATDLEWVRVADDNGSFVQEPSGRRFIPWGFNYDHQEGSGRLIEDYWHDQWAVVEQDFQEMRRLGANLVRVHLQWAAMMVGPDTPNPRSLDQLERLLELAERTGLYLDVTGLGCYHKQDVPQWYDELDEKQRWNAQAAFWQAVASRCASSPAVFCYDLMNEPVVPGDAKRDDWLGPAFAGKHFVQFITLSAAGRPRHEIAANWIRHLVSAIRKHDRRHLITVGLVPWSLDSNGKTVRDAMVLSWLELFQDKQHDVLQRSAFGNVSCPGSYPNHLQGICVDNAAIYWSFTTRLLKTDAQGRIVKSVDVADHHGDLCHRDGRLFVAVNLGRFNDPEGHADSWVYVYDADDLSCIARHKTPEVFYGAGGIACDNGRFLVVGGLPEGIEENYVYEYDAQFNFAARHVIASGYTRLGIQTAAFADRHWWFGCYGNTLLKTDQSLKLVGKYDVDCGLGIVAIPGERLLIGRGGGAGDKRTGKVLVARPDPEKGLVVLPPSRD